MTTTQYRWTASEIRNQLLVLDGKKSPTLVLQNATYLNDRFSKWMKGNIWIYKDRIVYVGNEMPSELSESEIVNCEKYHLVSGYIEPHGHPFQLYNPHSFANYSSKFGTTTLINDNMMLLFQNDNKKAFSLINDLGSLASSLYWWCRFDAQTILLDNNKIFSNENVTQWLNNENVIQGGELTGWPELLDGNDMMLNWLQQTKGLGKKVEGHFPGASEKTLAKMMLAGADCDHEAMTGKEVYDRLMQGYTVSLRNSSIRPDLENLLIEMKELGIDQYDNMILTTDGSTPIFYEKGLIDQMIKICIDNGIPPIEAYKMATINVARHYNLSSVHGSIATGRIAHINFLENELNPTPVSVLAKGNWIMKDSQDVSEKDHFDWQKYEYDNLNITWNLTDEDLQFSNVTSLKMVNNVIMKPYDRQSDISKESLAADNDELFLLLIDRHGKWRVNTVIKGFATNLDGLASSYSNTGDIILIGKRKQSIKIAFDKMKELGGGIVLVEEDRVIYELELTLLGGMSRQPVEQLIVKEKELVKILKEKGYKYSSPVYSLLFLSSTHLPYIRITQRGIFDVMKNEVLYPSVNR